MKLFYILSVKLNIAINFKIKLGILGRLVSIFLSGLASKSVPN